MAVPDDTHPSFPTYAELAQTAGWSGAPFQIASIPSDAALSTGGRYQEAAVLGIGGMGKVMLARDGRIGRDVAVKVMHSELEIAPEERERFLREAQVQGQLEHPSIVPVYDIDQRDDGSTFFTMRRVLGRTLAAILDDARAGSSKYTQRELLQAFGTICLTIDYAHTRGVVHRDLKPANIMLGDFGEVYVLDWGLARILDGSETSGIVPASRLSMPGTMMGTPLYMAPEQMGDPDVGPGADIYALGALLFEILTLEKVRDARALYAPVDARPSVRAPERRVAPELETICVRATQLLVTDRYPSARALQEAVARYLEGDRELEQRRVLAATHAARAREALANADADGADHEAERGTATRELVRSLALEPTNREHVAMFAEIIGTPPRSVPPDVEARLEATAQEMIHSGTRYGGVAMLSWFVFLPVLLAAGVLRRDYLIAIMIPTLTVVGLAYVASRQRTIGPGIQHAMLAMIMVASIGVSRIFGPLILVPTLLATWAIVMQAHPLRRLRIGGLLFATSAMVIPLVLEVAGVLPSSYAFSGGGLLVLPQMIELRPWFVIAFLGIANLSIALMPAVFVGGLRDDLARIQERELVRNWQLQRLGDDLMRAAG